MQTPDGAWRVEVIERGRTRWYRLTHEHNELDWLSIAAVQRILSEADVDMATSSRLPTTRQRPADYPQHGAA